MKNQNELKYYMPSNRAAEHGDLNLMIVYALKADRRIIDQKKNGEELDIEPRNEALNSFIEERIRYFSNEVKNVKSIAFPDSSKLNEIFRNAIYH